MIDFSLTSDQEAFVKTARDFGREVLGPAEQALDKLGDNQAVFADDRYWDVMRQAFDLGFHKMGMREEFGGLELGPQTSGLVWEELARWGVGFTASLMAGSVVPQLITFLAPMNERLIETYVKPFCEQDDLIFPPGEHYPMLHHAIITVGNLGTGYLALGLLRGAFEDALAHAKERVQWGTPICEHQLVAKKLFEASAAIESCRALLWKGSWHCANGFPGDLRTSLTAKITATNLASKHCAELVQVLGGYGLTKDYPLEKALRDAPLLQVMDGTNDTLMVKAAGLL